MRTNKSCISKDTKRGDKPSDSGMSLESHILNTPTKDLNSSMALHEKPMINTHVNYKRLLKEDEDGKK